MKVLLVIDSLGHGGAQRQIVALAKGLTLRKIEVEVYIYYPEFHFVEEIINAEIKLHVGNKNRRFSIKPIIDIVKLLNRNKFDLVISFLDTPNIYCEIACTVAMVKLIVSERSMYTSEKLSFFKWLSQQLHRLSNQITVNSHHQRLRMTSKFPWMNNKIKTIYNGYDHTVFKPKNNAIFNHTHEDLRLLAIASVQRIKNSISVAKALNICRDQYGLHVFINWVGALDSNEDVINSVNETSDYLTKNNLKDNWCWAGVKSNIVELLHTHHALIHPSFFEGLPNVICEALMTGMPVLASNVCDHPMLLNDKKCGFLFDPNDPQDIADKIYEFSQLNADQIDTMKTNARNYALSNLTLELYIDKYMNLINEVAA